MIRTALARVGEAVLWLGCLVIGGTLALLAIPILFCCPRRWFRPGWTLRDFP